MFKKIIVLACFFMFASLMQVNALVQSDYEALGKSQQISSIVNYDFFNFFNKSELIGYSLTNYNVATSQYKQFAAYTSSQIQSSVNQISLVKNNTDLTDDDKTIQINKLYQDIDAALYALDSQTLNYIFSLRNIMPNLTFQRFIKKFEEYYNSLNITENEIML